MPVRPTAASFGHNETGKRLRLVPLHDVRPNLGLGELADGAAQELLIARRAEVHLVKNIRIEARGRVAAW